MLEKIKLNKKVFLVNLVFGEVYCNLNCDYCSYPKEQPKQLSHSDWEQFKGNINRLKYLLATQFPACRVISITGGEPLLYPKIIEFIALSFPAYKIRVSTNGIMLSDQIVQKVKKLGNVYFAVSLDGYTFTSNIFRLASPSLLKLIIKNINKLTSNNIAVEVLTTLHKRNINDFWEFLRYLSSKYKQPVKDGKLWVLASPIVERGDNQLFSPSLAQIRKFGRELKINREMDMIKSVGSYYEELDKYYAGNKKRNICQMFEWALHLKYLGDSLWADGGFLLYGCGCRGIKVLGKFDLKSKFDSEIVVERKQSPVLVDFFRNHCETCKEDCFNNWQLYDLYFRRNADQEIKVLKNIL